MIHKLFMEVLFILFLYVCVPAGAEETTIGENAKGDKKERPKIGLVLGGGGALGLSHIGVLKALEKERIPVDYIAGTSMGAIIAGFYAAGMSPDEIAAAMIKIDWWDIMKDKTSYRDLDFRRKEESSRYLMDLELGLRGYSLMFPHGFAAGQKFNYLIQTLTVNATGIESFDNLNIPFRAIATDLRSGAAVVLDHGNLATAMRASMAVPGVFTPVDIEGNLLVDGGLVNNIPVDVVKRMGADIIIAVDVGSCEARIGAKSDFRSLGDILARTYAIMQRTKDDGRRKSADVLIEPDLIGLTASDFHRVAEFITRGMAAMEAHTNDMMRFSIGAAEYSVWQESHCRQRAKERFIRSVEITGNHDVSTALIMKRVELKPGDKLDFDRVKSDLARIHGMGDFQTVSYRLFPTGQPGEYDLKIETVEKYWGPNYLHLGMRLESDMDGASSFNALINVRQANLNSLGGESRLDIETGRDQGMFLEFYQPLQTRGFFFVAPSIQIKRDMQKLYEDGDSIAEYRKESYNGHFDFGVQYKEYGEIRAGVFIGRMQARPETGDTSLESADATLGAFTARLTFDRLDERVFARHGSYLGVNGYFSSDAIGADDVYNKIDIDARWFWSRGEHTLGIDIRGGHALGGEIPVYDQFLIGGMMAIPGVAFDELRGSYYDIAGLNYRYKMGDLSPSIGKGIYAIARFSAGNAWQKSSDIDEKDVICGSLIGLAMDTVFGPAAIAYGVAEEGRSQIYLTLGTVF